MVLPQRSSRRAGSGKVAAPSLQAKLLELDALPVQRPAEAVFTFRPQLRELPRTSHKRKKPWTTDNAQRIRRITPADGSCRAPRQPWAVARQSVTAPSNLIDDKTIANSSSRQPAKLPIWSQERVGLLWHESEASTDDMSHQEANNGDDLSISSLAVTTARVSARKLDLEHDLKITYAGNVGWKQQKMGSQHFVPYSKCVQAIVNREHLLVLLQDATATLDNRYFLYLARKIELMEAGSVDGLDTTTIYVRELLLVKEDAIRQLQQQFMQLLRAIILATVEVVDVIRAYRALPGVKVYGQDPLFTWKGKNYLLKMRADLDVLGASHVMRLWLGCHPPGYKPRGVDSSSCYNAGGNALLYVWSTSRAAGPFRLRNEQLLRLAKWKELVSNAHNAAITRVSMMSGRTSPSQSSRVNRKTNSHSRKGTSQMSTAQNVSSSSLLIPGPPVSSPTLSEPSCDASTDSTSVKTDMDAIKRTCLALWDERCPTWRDLLERPVVMEAAAGFDTLQPVKPLRPMAGIPQAKYRSVLQYIERELATSFQLAQDATNLTSLRLHMQTYQSNSVLPRKGPLISDESASILIQRRSTPALHKSLHGARSVSAPQFGSSSPSGLEAPSFFMTARDSPLRTIHHTNRQDRLPPAIRDFSGATISIEKFCEGIARNDAAIKLQMLVRQWLARARLRYLMSFKQRNVAATVIQTHVRRLLAIDKALARRRELQLDALEIRNVWKHKFKAGRLVIKAISRLQVRRKRKVKLQRLAESATQGPRRVMHNAATDIQRMYRGHLARLRVKHIRARRRFYHAARKINNAARIWLQHRKAARESAHLLRYASKNRVLLLRNARTPRKQGSLTLPE